MKKSTALLTATVLAASASLSTVAAAEVTANIGATSDYVWRGISQSGGDASVSGGVDYAHDSGFYAGTWVGSLGGGSEVDFYAGFGGEAGDISYDVGYIYYAYPAADPSIDFGEIYGSVGFGMFTAGLHFTVNSASANDGGGFDEGDIYGYVGAGGDLANDWTWSVTVGHYMFDNDSSALDIDYTHYGVDFGKSTELGDFTFSLKDTDLSSTVGGTLNADPQAIVSWGIGF